MRYKCIKDNEIAKSGDIVEAELIYSNPDYLPKNHIDKYVINGKHIRDVNTINTYFKKLKEHREDVIKKLIE